MERNELIEHVGRIHFGMPNFTIPVDAHREQWERIHKELHGTDCGHVHHEPITDEQSEMLGVLVSAIANNKIALVSVVVDGRSMAAVATIDQTDEEYHIRPLALIIDDATFDRIIPPPDDI